jgi:hypothetical protein
MHPGSRFWWYPEVLAVKTMNLLHSRNQILQGNQLELQKPNPDYPAAEEVLSV